MLTHAALAADAVVQYVAPTPSAAVNLNGVTGRTISSLLINADASITLTNCNNITILACDLKSISITNSTNIKVYNNYIHDNLSGDGVNYNDSIYIQGGSSIVVQGNRFERFGKGVDAQNTTGGVQVIGNYMRDIQKVVVWPQYGEAVQFNGVSGAGNAISSNYMINYWTKSGFADVISLYKSNGTAASPIMIESNFISGDPAKGTQDQPASPDGITMGDNGGSYQVARNNVLLNPAQGGIGVAGGGNMTVEGNKVYGTQSNVSNVGIYVWNQGGGAGGPVTVKNNTIAWKNANGTAADYWNGGGFSSVTENGNSFGNWAAFNPLPAPPTDAPLPPKLYGNPAIIPWQPVPEPAGAAFLVLGGAVLLRRGHRRPR